MSAVPCIPYKGSKRKLAERLVALMPPADTFVDLFAGGGAATSAALLSGKYKRVVMNDIDPGLTQLYADAAAGMYRGEDRWISREDFHRLKGSDAYVRTCWSFGNNCQAYLYAREVEPWKRALHHAAILSDASPMEAFGLSGCPLGDRSALRRWVVDHAAECRERYVRWYVREAFGADLDPSELARDLEGELAAERERLRSYLREALGASGLTAADVQRRLGNQMAGHYFGSSQWEFPTPEAYERMREFMPLPLDHSTATRHKDIHQSLQSLKSLQSLQSLQQLENLKRLENLQSLKSLKRHAGTLRALQMGYDEVPLDGLGSVVVYCDPPYAGTMGYASGAFDHGRFHDWCRAAAGAGIPVFISEYSMPEDFANVWAVRFRSTYSSTSNATASVERLFVHGSYAGRLPSMLF